MTMTRCPQCQLPMTSAESQAGVCPVCATTLAGSKSVAVAAPLPAKHGFGFLRASLLGLCLFFGGLGGFLLHPVFADDDDSPQTAQPKAVPDSKARHNSAPTAIDVAKSLEHAQELETLAATLAEELEAEQAKSTDALAQAEAARRELYKLRAEISKPKDGRAKELLALTDKLHQELEALKKELLQAKTREDVALRAADLAAKPQGDRVLAAETLNKKLQKAVDTQARLTKEATGREEAARRQTEQVRQEGQRSLEQQRQQQQRVMEQLRQESQRSLEQVRQQLRQQELVTQKVRVDLEHQKRATEEAKRKNK